MTIRSIFEKYKIKYFAAIPINMCKVANERLYRELPLGAYAVFALFPYYVENRNSSLSAFAAVPDYHIFAKILFDELCEHIKTKYSDTVFARGYTDHSPLNERDGAAKCSLGVLGQNGLLIAHEYSSFVTIGELICTLSQKQLEDEGISIQSGEIAYCESCGQCISACPANAAGGDMSGCISALTQKKGELSLSETDALRKNGYAWGCDKCQMACPHTKKAIAEGTIYTPIDFFSSNVILGSLQELEALSDEDYKKHTFSYRKRNVMTRNINILKEK